MRLPNSLGHHLRRLAGEALQLLFPPTCVGCEQPGHAFCPACAQRVQPVGAAICNRCGRDHPQPLDGCPACDGIQPAGLRQVRAATIHAEPMRSAIHALKYDGRTELAEELARYLTVAFVQSGWQQLPYAIDGVAPVPLHAQRLAERGYNQSALLAAGFCAQMGLPYTPALLLRRQFTRAQVGLSAQERRANVAGAFAAAGSLSGRTLLLIDDVYTTGSTLAACAEAALEAGARAIYALTLACPRFQPIQKTEPR